MLLSQNQLVREVRWMSRMTITLDGKPCTKHDRHQFITVSILRFGLECDLLPGTSFSNGIYRRSLHSVKEIDLKLYFLDLKMLKSHLLVELENNQFQPDSWLAFKRRVSHSIHYKWMLSIVGKLYPSIRSMLQWIVFDERLQVDTNDDISDEISEYVAFEEGLKGLQYDDTDTEPLANIIREWFDDLHIALVNPRPKFGPGATAELGRKSVLEKIKSLNADYDTVQTLCEHFCRDYDEIVPYFGEPNWTNRIIFVPKNALKHRIISAEPTWLTWIQQIFKDVLISYIERNKHLNSWFNDQELSRRFAMKGSVSGDYATIDFSNASDSITTTLVHRLFSGTQLGQLFPLLRSRQAEMPDGQVIELEKFAPMGSAICFFVMDVVFLAICEWSVRETLKRPSRPSDYVVYGDDVCIRTECVEAFLGCCSRLHLHINVDKSYTNQIGTKYREACGIECLNGEDITPLRYSRHQGPILTHATVDVTYWASTVDLLNRLQLKGYVSTRSACNELLKFSMSRGRPNIVRSAQRIFYHLLRIDEGDYREGYDGPLAIVVPDGTASNYRCKCRYNRDLQRVETRVLCPTARPLGLMTDEDELAAYVHWFYAQKHKTSDYLDNEVSVAGTMPFKWEWYWFGH